MGVAAAICEISNPHTEAEKPSQKAGNLIKILHRGAPRLPENYKPKKSSRIKVSSDLRPASSLKTFLESPTLSRVMATSIIGFVLYGLYLECIEWPDIGDRGTLPFKVLLWKFSFYTVQSNSLIALYYLSVLTCNKQVTELSKIIKSCALMMITITMLVWHVVLTRTIDLDIYVDWKPRWASHTLHTIVPLLCWFDWIVIDKLKSQKQTLRKRIIPFFLVCPLAYLAFSFIRASVGGPYGISHITGEPFWHWYPFIETSNPIPIYPGASRLQLENSNLIVFLNCLVIAIAVIVGGLGFVVLDNKMLIHSSETRR